MAIFQTLTCKVFVRNLFNATGRGKFSPNLGFVKSEIGFVQQVKAAFPSFGSKEAFMYLKIEVNIFQSWRSAILTKM